MVVADEIEMSHAISTIDGEGTTMPTVVPEDHLAGFAGFPPDGPAFLRDLVRQNDVAWFDRHRGVYVDGVREPAKALVLALGEALHQRGIDGVQAEPRVGRSLFRINRDTRFSADPTPYHPHLDVVLWKGSHPRLSPALLLRLTGDQVTTGVGIMGLKDERLQRFRHAVVDPASGTALVAALAEVRTAVRRVEISTPTRVRVPAGWPADHPRGHLLRLDALHATATEPIPKVAHGSRFVRWVVDRHLRYVAVLDWLADHVEDAA